MTAAHEQVDAERLRAEIAKLTSHTIKIGLESPWSPVLFAGSIVAGATVTIFALMKMLGG